MSRTEHLETILPGLIPVEVFDYYDGPRFYSCRDIVGQLYVIYWIDETEVNTTWLYSRVSPERYASLKQGIVTVAFALANPEEGSAFVVKSSSSGVFIEEIPKNLIDFEWLPPADVRLSLQVETLPTKTASALEVATRANRQVFDLAFERISNSYEMSCGKLGRLLDAVQKTIFAFACPPDRDVRKVPEEIKFKSEVLVTGLFASSFGVRLQTKGSDLFSSDESAKALKTLVDLIAAMEDPDKLQIDVHKLNILSRSRFKHLLEMKIEAEISIVADWGAPSGVTLKARASYADISRAITRLEAADDATTQTIQKTGKLVGVDVQSNFFALVVEENEVLKGTLEPSIAMQQFEIPSRINASMRETCVIDPLTDREKWTYVLLSATKAS